MMLAKVPQPLAYAETLMKQFTSLSRAGDSSVLLRDLVRGVADLSSCELVQLYLLDPINTSLVKTVQCLNEIVQPCEATGLPADHRGEQLLQFALCHNRVLCLDNLDTGVYETGFLPAQPTPWQSLLCVPLVNQQKIVAGLLVSASARRVRLQCFAHSLSQIGSFALGQLELLQSLHRSAGEKRATARMPRINAYGLIGRSAAMRRTYLLISKVLQGSYTVLLQGETGTGKEVVARAIHEWGSRRSKPFIVQNCAAIPEHLLESELFGYRKGAFTGADCDRVGLFDAANGGTLLLDEIGDMPPPLQAKVLRVLQDGEIRPLGSTETHRIDVRIIAATHRDLPTLTYEGKFREDLYYRLAQFPIELPPLRHRGDDIQELARHFAVHACARLRRGAVSWSADVLCAIRKYSFPGNVRQLKGMVERAVLLCEGDQLQLDHFSPQLKPVSEARHFGLREQLEQVERALLLDCLRKHAGNKTLAARELGLPRRTLLYRMDRLKMKEVTADVDA